MIVSTIRTGGGKIGRTKSQSTPGSRRHRYKAQIILPGFSCGLRLFLPALLSVMLMTASLKADVARIAVAANFANVIKELEHRFENATDYRVSIVTGSTGKLYAQIVNGAPYEVFLSADAWRPRLLEQGAFAIPGTRFTYAIGQLVIWSLQPLPDGKDLAALLTNATVRRIAVPNPELAPFGFAALEVINHLDIADDIAAKLVFAENVGQSFAFVATGNADLGFVAKANILFLPDAQRGHFREVPTDLHLAIRQDAVTLKSAADNEAALAFVEFLRSQEARAVIARYGYQLADND
ncbi:MAG: molybdate ABC transporter substrate-binding protein [Rhodobacteraceae bacterium]|nr:molybdate ABC transporter substrate-binding protein [Paracoccaceae bacterium]